MIPDRYENGRIYQFNFPTLIRFGCGVWREIAPFLKEEGLSRVLLVTDPIVGELEFFHRIRDSIESTGIASVVWKDIHKNPVKSDVLRGRQAYVDGECEGIVGVGGGAALDVARAVALAVHHTRDLFDYDDLKGGERFVTEPIPPFYTVPTTAGTGSEVGRSAIISEDETHRKRILFSPRLMARRVFADPTLTYDLPPGPTAATGMDALTHNMEAFLARNFHPICDGVALEGMALIVENIRTAVEEPRNEKARALMLLGSMMGAIAFQKGLGVVHSLSHPLSTLVDMHHGLANAINLPVGMGFNRTYCTEKFDRMAQRLGLPSGEHIPDFLRSLNASIGIPPSLGDTGVPEKLIPALVDLAVQDFAHPNNPVPVSREDFERLYAQAFGMR
ncbi:MAG: iron-containing alcohol dehydrogenase [Flavobacteriales bacterium]|nr:iron-containing alcohol dehydrogenase [Flavobacteriales bacterium]MCX7768257.1 iron-containing alcohol dehydrogenase [Flavobacteriales bacterium]MDW8410579.1 iron-containing alcohol dehydrogenase [Flavobacteriales bacterium]